MKKFHIMWGGGGGSLKNLIFSRGGGGVRKKRIYREGLTEKKGGPWQKREWWCFREGD